MRKTVAGFARAILILAVLFVGPGLFGQDKEATSQAWVAQSFSVKHINVERLRPLFNNLQGTLTTDPQLGLLIYQGPPGIVAFVRETIAKLDVPSQKPTREFNVEITVYLLGAGREASGSPEVGPVLQPVVKELRERFPYQNYRLLESAVLRVRPDSSGESSGVIPRFLPESLASAPPTLYTVRAALGGVSSGEETSNVIALKELRLSVRIPVITSREGAERLEFQFHDVGINTNLSLREGQTVVVGKAGVQGAVDGIFLVLKADLVD